MQWEFPNECGIHFSMLEPLNVKAKRNLQENLNETHHLKLQKLVQKLWSTAIVCQGWEPGSSHLLIQCSVSVTSSFQFLLTSWTLWSPFCLERQWRQTYKMFSEYIFFMIDEIHVFMLCDRWFPGTLALVLLLVGILCAILFVCFVGFFVVVASYFSATPG